MPILKSRPLCVSIFRFDLFEPLFYSNVSDFDFVQDFTWLQVMGDTVYRRIRPLPWLRSCRECSCFWQKGAASRCLKLWCALYCTFCPLLFYYILSSSVCTVWTLSLFVHNTHLLKISIFLSSYFWFSSSLLQTVQPPVTALLWYSDWVYCIYTLNAAVPHNER